MTHAVSSRFLVHTLAALLLPTLLLAGMFVATSPAKAAVDGYLTYTYIAGSDSVEVTGCNGGAATCPTPLVIPDTINVDGLPKNVTRIGFSAFSGATNVTSISIGQNVTEIRSSAFRNIQNVTTLNLPASVSEIGSSAFRDTGIIDFTVGGASTTLSVQGGVLFNLAATELVAYPAGRVAVAYTIPDGVTTIGFGAFSGTPIETVTLPSSLSEIKSYAFQHCTELRTAALPETLTKIGYSAFKETDLSSVSIPAGVSEIEPTAFAEVPDQYFSVDPSNASFESVDGVLFNKGATVLVQYPIARTATTYDIPNSTMELAEASFAFSDYLTTMTLGGNISIIGDGAFDSTGSLASVTFGPSITHIVSLAFGGAPLTDVHFLGDAPIFDTNAFRSSGSVPFYYRYGTTGWGSLGPINGHPLIEEGRPAADPAPVTTDPAPVTSSQTLRLALPTRLQRGKKYVLPSTTVQGQPVRWKLTDKKYCKIKSNKLTCSKSTGKKSFRFTATAPRTASLNEFTGSYVRKVK